MMSQSRAPLHSPNGNGASTLPVDGRFASAEATRNPMKRYLLLAAGIVLLLSAFFLLRHCSASAGDKFQTTVVTKGPITRTVTATGTLNPVVNVQVGSQISGNISKLYVDYNSNVKAGQVVAEIEPSVFKAAVMQAQGDLASAKAALELAEVNAKRTEDLVKKQSSAQSDLDQAMAALHQARASVQIKEGALQKAQTDLDHCTIKSPIDGTVISRSVDVGQTVAASLQAPVIFTIANDLTKMQIDANVAEADVGVVEKGQNVDFTVDAFPNRTFHGQVVQVRNAPITVQNVVTYDAVISVSNPDLKLKPGMTANVSIIIAQRDDVLKVANAALRYRPASAAEQTAGTKSHGAGRRGGGAEKEARQVERTVYILPNGAGEPTPVQIKTGISDGVMTEVIEGLKEGDRVVTAALSASGGASGRTTNPFVGGRRHF